MTVLTSKRLLRARETGPTLTERTMRTAARFIRRCAIHRRAASDGLPLRSGESDQEDLMEKMKTNRQELRPVCADLLLGTHPKRSGFGFGQCQDGRLCEGTGERSGRGLSRDEIAANGPAIVRASRVMGARGADAHVLVMGLFLVLPSEERQGVVALPALVRMVPAASQHGVGRQHRNREMGK
jgi:hypothetical protein